MSLYQIGIGIFILRFTINSPYAAHSGSSCFIYPDGDNGDYSGYTDLNSYGRRSPLVLYYNDDDAYYVCTDGDVDSANHLIITDSGGNTLLQIKYEKSLSGHRYYAILLILHTSIWSDKYCRL